MEQVLLDDILILRPNLEKEGNSFGVTSSRSLMAAMQEHPQAPLIYSPIGRFFCMGGNLKEQSKPNSTFDEQIEIRNVLSSVYEREFPTVAVVNGDCVGGGLELLSAFDYVVSMPQCFFGLWQRRLGLCFGWGGESRLRARIGEHGLRRLFLGTQLVSSFTAKNLGLVDEVERAPMESALNWIKKSKESVGPYKYWLEESSEVAFKKLWKNPTHKKVLNRFSE